MGDASEYERFIISEHQVSAGGAEPALEQATPSQSIRKAPSQSISDAERNRLTRLVVRRLLSQSPYSTKYEDVRLIVKHHLPETGNYAVLNLIIDSARSVLSSVFGLSLEDVRYAQGRRELFLKQSISFGPHDHRTLSQGDHELRGFLLLLVPCFRAHNNELSLKFLCEVFEKVGRAHMVPRCKEDEEELVQRLRAVKRKRDVKYSSREFAHISDYLLYAKDLGYIALAFQQGVDQLSSVVIAPGYRLDAEFDNSCFVEAFRRLDEAAFGRGLDVFFE